METEGNSRVQIIITVIRKKFADVPNTARRMNLRRL